MKNKTKFFGMFTALATGVIAMALALALGSAAGASAQEGLTIPAPVVNEAKSTADKETAIFAGGCFWGVQGVFQRVDGVTNAVSGYAGGMADTAVYETVGSGTTGHAESVRVTFDPRKVSYGHLLQIYFSVAHDPTQLNRQGNDTGTQYRSGIYYTTTEQKETAESLIRQITADKLFGRPIVTEVQPMENYWPAEEYHQDFFEKNPTQGYCLAVAAPKVAKFRKTFVDLTRK